MRAGKVISQVSNQLVVSFSGGSVFPQLGLAINSGKSKSIGKSSDVIGRVSSPYVVVKLNKKFIDKSFVGETVYAVDD